MNLNTAGGDAVDQSTLSNMRVLLAGFDQQGLYVFREAVVDANGRYRFEDVPQGNFQLSVKSKLENVEGETRAIAVAAGEELEIDLTVTLKPLNISVQSEAVTAAWGWTENSLYLTCFVLIGFATSLLTDSVIKRPRRGIPRVSPDRRGHRLRTTSTERI